jgi:AAA domain/Bifunctional DNA primase/polymerase, N-terminal
VRDGIPKGARLLHVYQSGEVMHNGKRAEGKEPREKRGHLDAVPQADFLDMGGNIGIALDGQFVVLDFDVIHPKVDELRATLPPTWTQKTLRGTHYLYRVPVGWQGTNTKLLSRNDDGKQIILGDIKANGYIVGPGSVRDAGTDGIFCYSLLDDRDPVMAPDWVFERARDTRTTDSIYYEDSPERDRIELGRNDEELVKLAGYLRHQGFSVGAIETMLTGVIDSGILEQDPSREAYSPHDARRIAKSASKWSVGPGGFPPSIKPLGWINGIDISMIGGAMEWWVHGYIPKGQLCLMYGEGGIGKSTFASWLAAQVTKAGGKFVFIGVEEPFRLFAARAAIMGANLHLLYAIPDADALRFPKHAEELASNLTLGKADFVYFDSIYTHFEHSPGENMAERARKSLGPLAKTALVTGATVLGTFHENKAQEFLGSTEMMNVCRVLMRVTRKPGEPLRVSIRKTNLLDPGCDLEFEATEEVWRDPRTGEVQMERQPDGSLLPVRLMLPMAEPRRIDKGTARLSQLEQARKTWSEQAIRKATDARALHEQGKTTGEIMMLLGISKATLFRYLKESHESHS